MLEDQFLDRRKTLATDIIIIVLDVLIDGLIITVLLQNLLLVEHRLLALAQPSIILLVTTLLVPEPALPRRQTIEFHKFLLIQLEEHVAQQSQQVVDDGGDVGVEEVEDLVVEFHHLEVLAQ